MTTPEQLVESRPPAPWGWFEAITIHLVVLAVAFAIQWKMSYAGSFAILPPWNWVCTGGLVVIAMLLGAFVRNQPWMRWLSGPKFAVTAIISVSVLALLGALILQHTETPDRLTPFGVRNMYHSIPFLMMGMMMLVNLSAVLGRRLLSRKPGNLGFVLNHAGLILVIVGMVAGSAQFIEGSIQLHQGMPANIALDERDRPHDLGAMLTLKRFEIEWYPTQLSYLRIVDPSQSHGYIESKDSQWAESGRSFDIENIKGRIITYLPSAEMDLKNKTYIAAKGRSTLSAALIEVSLAEGTIRDWITIDNGRPGNFLWLDRASRQALFLSSSPKAFRSYLSIDNGKTINDKIIAVNQPLHIAGWDLYQASYQPDPMTGQMASVLQAVHDPALPLIYAGFIAMLIGAFLAFWAPRRRETTRPEKLDIEEPRVEELV